MEEKPEYKTNHEEAEHPVEGDRKHEWVVHVTGADDIHPQPDELTALREANALNRMMAEMERTERHPICFAIVKDEAAEAL